MDTRGGSFESDFGIPTACHMLIKFSRFAGNLSIVGFIVTYRVNPFQGSDLVPEADLVLSWSLVHDKNVSSAREVTVSGKAVSTKDPSAYLMLGEGCTLGILQMKPATWTWNMTQSPPLACTRNLVRVCISTDIPLIHVVPSIDVTGCTSYVGRGDCTSWCENRFIIDGSNLFKKVSNSSGLIDKTLIVWRTSETFPQDSKECQRQTI
jgi:hypothetical protein